MSQQPACSGIGPRVLARCGLIAVRNPTKDKACARVEKRETASHAKNRLEKGVQSVVR